MRLVQTNLTYKDVQPKLKELIDNLFKRVPAGVGSEGFVKLNKQEFKTVIEDGAKWGIQNNYGWEEDLEFTEANGCMKDADSDKVSNKAIERGIKQIGTLGSGNHYLEIQRIKEENIFDNSLAKKLGLFDDQIVIMFHCGSRGFGHQVATDYLRVFLDVMEKKYKIKILDRELACAPFNSPEGQDYFSAMKCGINMSFANRQVILHRIREAFSKIFNQSPESLEMHQIYDVAHNTAKLEEHKVDGQMKKLLVHRKGSTRSFPPGHKELPKKYQEIGQPVILGGSMETGSYLLTGMKEGASTFYSTCFPGDTKIITDQGILDLSEIYKKFNGGENILVPSVNENTFNIEWKEISDVMKRKSDVIEVSISQRGKITQNKLRTTRDHKFITIDDGKIIHKEIHDIITNKEAIFLLDNLSCLVEKDVKDSFAYLVGSLMSDGSFRLVNGKYGDVVFTQKKVTEKINFINHVSSCFKENFAEELIDEGTYIGGGIINGRQVWGAANRFRSYSAVAAKNLLEIDNNISGWVLSLSQTAVLNFLAGLIDGDGGWDKNRKVLNIYNGDEKIVGAAVLACLRLGILPYVSKQRNTCYIIQISEKEELLFKYTKRINDIPKKRRYGAKLYSVKQLFKDTSKIKWPFLQKAKKNNLMSDKQITKHISKYPEKKEEIKKLINSSLRMQRINRVRELGEKEVFNITVEDNHNYFVMTDMFIPVLVKNCHGSGRTMSRMKAKKIWNGQQLQKDMEKRGIFVKTTSFSGLAEEAGGAYKSVDEVCETAEKAGISKRIVKLIPLANVKG